jgi:hypothetical protein
MIRSARASKHNTAPLPPPTTHLFSRVASFRFLLDCLLVLMDPINERMGVGAAEAAAEEPIEPPAPDPPLASPLALVVGQQFDTFQDFKAALIKWAVSQRFGSRFEKSDRLRNVVRDNEFVAVLCLLARALRIIVYYSVKP